LVAVSAIDWSLIPFADLRKSTAVGELAEVYLRLRARELEPGGYKSVRYSVGLFVSRHADTLIASLGRDDGRAFLGDIAGLSASLGQSYRHHGWSLAALLEASHGCHDKITVVTQRRIWSQVRYFLKWAIYEGHLETDPFQTVRFEGNPPWRDLHWAQTFVGRKSLSVCGYACILGTAWRMGFIAWDCAVG
jgi:hypothetical protein